MLPYETFSNPLTRTTGDDTFGVSVMFRLPRPVTFETLVRTPVRVSIVSEALPGALTFKFDVARVFASGNTVTFERLPPLASVTSKPESVT
jgi:hypothetical protein